MKGWLSGLFSKVNAQFEWLILHNPQGPLLLRGALSTALGLGTQVVIHHEGEPTLLLHALEQQDFSETE